MNAFKYINAIYSYFTMIVNTDVKKEIDIDQQTHAFKNAGDIIQLKNQTIYDIESDGGILKYNYDIESDGGITRDHIFIKILINEERGDLNI